MGVRVPPFAPSNRLIARSIDCAEPSNPSSCTLYLLTSFAVPPAPCEGKNRRTGPLFSGCHQLHDPYPVRGNMAGSKAPGLSDNSIGALAYCTPFPAIFFLAIHRYNKRPYVRFHAWQSLVFFAFAFIFCYPARIRAALYCDLRSPPFPGGALAGDVHRGCHFSGMALVRNQRIERQALQTPDPWSLVGRASLPVTRPNAREPRMRIIRGSHFVQRFLRYKRQISSSRS